MAAHGQQKKDNFIELKNWHFLSKLNMLETNKQNAFRRVLYVKTRTIIYRKCIDHKLDETNANKYIST